MVITPLLANAQWTRKSDALRKRGESPSIVYKGKIYVFGGFGEHPAFEDDNEVYDPALNKWTLIAPFPSGKEVSHQGVTLVDDKVWHIGGRAINADGPVTSQVLIYDITDNSWSVGPELKDPATGKSLPLGGGGVALIGRTIHVFGGFAPTICIDQSSYHLTLDVDRWLADPLNTKWENKLAPMPIPRNHLNTAVLGGKIYALGGQFGHDCNGADQVYCHVYDPETDTWTRLTDLPSARSHSEGGTFSIDGRIYMVGGQGPSGVAQNTVLIFNPAANNGLGSWANVTEYQLPNNYYGISAKVVGNLFILSHGALTNITNERIETYTAPITRNTPYEFGFSVACINKTVMSGRNAVVNNLLYTIEGEKGYSLSSNADWLKITKNASGVALQSGVEIEATIDATDLPSGDYTATITVSGTGGGPEFKNSSFCVNIKVLSESDVFSLTATAVGKGTVTKDPDQNSYAAASTVTLTATPETGYWFSGWTGDATGSVNPLSVIMDEDKTITANFASYKLINAGGERYSDETKRQWAPDAFFSGGEARSKSFDVTGTTDDALYLNYRNATSSSSTMPGTPLRYNIPVDAGTYNIKLHFTEPYFGAPGGVQGIIGARVFHVDIEGQRVLSNYDIYAQDGAGKAVVKTFNGVNITDDKLDILFTSVKNNALISAIEFEKVTTTAAYVLNVSTTGNGTVSKSPDQPTYTEGSTVTLTATPASGYQFAGWSGNATGTQNPLTITMDANKNITATFTQVQQPGELISNIRATTGRTYTLSELVVGKNIYTDRTYKTTTVPDFLIGTPFIQTPNDDKFSNSSSLLTFELSQAATVYVAYDPRATSLPNWLSDWQRLPDRIGINDSKISYMTLYSKIFAAGTVTLGGNMVSPAAGAQNNYFVIAKAEQTTPVNYILSINTSGSGMVSKSPNQASYAAGSSVTLTATPATGYRFAGWSGDASGTANPLTLTMNSNKTVMATFTQTTYLLNAGGTQFVDGQALTWSADAYFSGGVTASKSFDVAGTTEDGLYLDYRYAASSSTAPGAPFSYAIPVGASGTYTVKLHFLEPYFGAPGGKTSGLTGARVFHVDVEGQRVLSNYDIYSQDGAGKAIVKTFSVSVTDGTLNLLFTSVKNNAIISAIEVLNTSGSVTATATSTLQAPEQVRASLTLYPNPSQAGGRVTAELRHFGEQEAVDLVVLDETGRIIKTLAVVTDKQGQAPIEFVLEHGFYIIRAKAASGEVAQKLIVQ